MTARHFATIGSSRQVHYRRAGSGPALLLLHQSPASSREFLPLIDELAADYTVIAPDTPGNGLSDPLEPTAPMEAYADGMAAFMDEIGLERALVYGFHTGAACALALAHRHPSRVVAGIANGYTQLLPAELEDILAHYLPPFVSDWSGAHLLWAWARIREQYLFFPWYRHDGAARLRSGLPRVERIHEAVMDLLRSGDHYRYAYRAAFAYDREAALGEMSRPMLVMTAQTDALYPYLDRMPLPSPSVRVARPANYAQAKALLREALADHARAAEAGGPAVLPAAPPASPARPVPGRVWSDMLPVTGGCLHARRSCGGGGLPILLCHDTAGSARGLEPLMRALAGRRPMLAVDLPGNGATDPLFSGDITVRGQACLLEAAVRRAGFDRVDVFAQGGGATVAAELAARHGGLVQRVVIVDTPPLPPLPASATVPSEYGTHLIELWNRLRDSMLFEPGAGRGREHVRVPADWQLQTMTLHARTLDLLECLPVLGALQRAHADYPLGATLARLGTRLRRLDSSLATDALALAALAAFDAAG